MKKIDKAERDYVEWSKKVRADAKEHCSEIWAKNYGGNYVKEECANTNFNNGPQS